MPVHVQEMTGDITVAEGDMPLSPAQLERLVALVISRLDKRKRDAAHIREATTIRRRATPQDMLDCRDDV